ncbi:MAG: hypothetical protein M3Z21_06800 [Pseudomonadota bacterium]|nr:hypothetical protein [Pseudomonadota bacterium]
MASIAKTAFIRSALYMALALAGGTARGVDIASTPLVARSAPPPNVMFLIDNSQVMGTVVQEVANSDQNRYDPRLTYPLPGGCPAHLALPSTDGEGQARYQPGSYFGTYLSIDYPYGGDNYLLYGTPATDPLGDRPFRCFANNERYTLFFMVDRDYRPLATGITSHFMRSVSGNYLNWYFDFWNTEPDWVGTNTRYEAGRTCLVKPGVRTRLDAVKAGFANAITELAGEGKRVRVGVASTTPSNENQPQGATIHHGLAQLTPAYAQQLQTTVNALRLPVDERAPAGLYQTLYDIGRYFLEGGAVSQLTLHPHTPDGSAVPIADVFPTASRSRRRTNNQTTLTVTDTCHARNVPYNEPLLRSTAPVVTESLPNYVSSTARPAADNPAILDYCQKNYVIVMTSGDVPDLAAANLYFRQTGNLGAVTPTTFTDPLLQATHSLVNYVPGSEQVFGVNLHAFANVAIALHDIDLRPDLNAPADGSTYNNLNTYMIGFGDDFETNIPLEDMGVAARQAGGDAYSVRNLEELKNQIIAIIDTIAVRAATANAGFSSTRLQEGTQTFQASYSTQNWTGELEAYALGASGVPGALPQWRASQTLTAQGTSRRLFTHNGNRGVAFQWNRLANSQRNDLRSEVPSG